MSPRRRIIDWIGSGLLIVIPALVLRASLRDRDPSYLDRAILQATAPLSAGVSWLIESVGGLWGRYVAVVDVEAENRELRGDNERLRRQLAEASRRAHEVTTLEQLVQLKQSTTADTLAARVIAAPVTPFFRVVRLRIDRGQAEVEVGMPVISSAGLVGRISQVYGNYADVVLISDASSSVDVVLPRTAGRGVLAGLGESSGYACKLQWLERAAGDQVAGVQVGDHVVTSGLGAAFPAGIPVGTVTAVSAGHGMFQEVMVEPAVDVAKLRAVMVLLAPPPPPDPDGGKSKRPLSAFGSRPY
jgi:rod shape-determining protein MreC